MFVLPIPDRNGVSWFHYACLKIICTCCFGQFVSYNNIQIFLIMSYTKVRLQKPVQVSACASELRTAVQQQHEATDTQFLTSHFLQF